MGQFRRDNWTSKQFFIKGNLIPGKLYRPRIFFFSFVIHVIETQPCPKPREYKRVWVWGQRFRKANFAPCPHSLNFSLTGKRRRLVTFHVLAWWWQNSNWSCRKSPLKPNLLKVDFPCPFLSMHLRHRWSERILGFYNDRKASCDRQLDNYYSTRDRSIIAVRFDIIITAS